MLGLDKDPPPGISLHWLDESQTLDVMLNEGQIDGAWGFAPHYDRGTENFKNIDRYGGTPIIGNARIRRKDPYPLGIRANVRMLDILMQASFKEGLTKKLARVDEIFYPTTLDT